MHHMILIVVFYYLMLHHYKNRTKLEYIMNHLLRKLEKYNPTSPDYSIQFAYIQFMLDLPWGEMSDDNLDLKHAQEVLDEDHFGLDQVKDRIIEYLAVLKLKGTPQAARPRQQGRAR